MQCPTCGSHTPGTLGTCPNCNAPFGQADTGAPLGAPPAPELGDQTMVVPPFTPSWSNDPPAQHPDTPPPFDAFRSSGGFQSPGSPSGYEPAGGHQPSGGYESAGGPEPSDGPSESTAPWAFEADEDSGGFPAPPPPAWASEQPSNEPPQPSQPPAPLSAPPPPAASPSPVSGFQPAPMDPGPPVGSEVSGPQESIVPESWYARPRRPDAQREREPDVERWTSPPSGQGFGADGPAGQTAVFGAAPHGGPNTGPGTGPHTGPNTGPHMGATQLDGQPMGMGPMGPMGGSLGPPMGPMGPMGNEYGMGGPPPSGPSTASKPLLIGVSALVTVALLSVVMVLWPTGDDQRPPVTPPTPSPSQNTPVAEKKPLPAVRQQAAKVNELLNASAGTRRHLAGALNNTAKCETLPAAIRGFQNVAQQRKSQLRRARALEVDRLKNGERMRKSMGQVFQTSLEADMRLLAWANRARKGCRGKPRPAVGKAPGRVNAERRATIAKKRFVVMWNPVARATGLPARKWNGL